MAADAGEGAGMSGETPALAQVPKGNARGSGYERAKNDWYTESPAAVRALLASEPFWGTIHDPACGAGNIPKTCIEMGHAATGSDLIDRGYGQTGFDYLESNQRHDNLVSNPPFNLSEKFALKALAEARHKVALLVRLSWLEGDGRHKRLFKPHPPARVLVFINRLSMPPGGVDMPAKGGAVAYAWVVWEKGHRGPTQFDWIRA